MTDQVRPVFTGISTATRSALEKMAPAEAVSVMNEMLQLASGNNNNNNDSGDYERSLRGLSREQLLQRMNALSDDQLHAVLRGQGIL
jgi:hypothetical protein